MLYVYCALQDGTDETLPPSSDDGSSPDAERFVIKPAAEVGSMLYEGILLIHNTSKSDYASYKCVATNDLGEDTSSVTLHGTSEYAHAL